MDIFRTLLQTLESEPAAMLATIIATEGSTPASALSRMVITKKGWTGTVGGGCMEADVVQAARDLHDTGNAKIITFHLNEDDMVQGLICGGSLDVLIEPVTRGAIPFYEELQTLRNEGEDCVVATLIGNNGRIEAKKIVRDSAQAEKWMSDHPTIQLSKNEFIAALERAFHRAETQRVKLAGPDLLLEPVSGRPHLMIFGGGHVSRYISRTASMTGFRVTVIDDRPQYANAERFPEADATLAVEYYDAFNQLTIKPSTSVVIVTRGHRADEEILERVIASPAKYIGMIGSKRKILTTYEHLNERGVTTEQLKRVHAPMGLEIGATTAEEIAVSVVAELIRVRRNAGASAGSKSEAMQGLIEKLR